MPDLTRHELAVVCGFLVAMWLAATYLPDVARWLRDAWQRWRR